MLEEGRFLLSSSRSSFFGSSRGRLLLPEVFLVESRPPPPRALAKILLPLPRPLMLRADSGPVAPADVAWAGAGLSRSTLASARGGMTRSMGAWGRDC